MTCLHYPASIPDWVLRLGLTGAELSVYIALNTFAPAGMDVHPQVKDIADRAGVSTRTAERSLTRLCDLGLVERTRWYRDDGGIGGCRYRFPLPTDTTHECAGEQQ